MTTRTLRIPLISGVDPARHAVSPKSTSVVVVIHSGSSEVVAHLGNFTSGEVSVLFMCQSGRSLALSRRWIRPLLRYKVIPNPVREREVLAKLQRINALIAASHGTPDRQRGNHARRHLFRGGGGVSMSARTFRWPCYGKPGAALPLPTIPALPAPSKAVTPGPG